MRLALAPLLLASACSAGTSDTPPAPAPAPPADGRAPDARAPALADVQAVEVSGEAGAYNFTVTVASADVGCEGYADWWEVVDADENLVYRRTLSHSHVGEQPFTRSGGPVAVAPEAVLVIRAHFAPGGYGGVALRGSVAEGFAPAEFDASVPVSTMLAARSQARPASHGRRPPARSSV
ncbi:hypothetical protein [Haliangium ochraceum]|uniref:Lipoprotein n=1 Tax=Haliangium ochraceum (strain DSM 14365 / JCM 11303 / SMP-2) TaxID=502025 RepID=D0LGX5_HALO1|nr:hypothetical protein [Haliangium ochraceum]ACY14697.1 hypothetical protein Hoch_2152 [Haliangium ochraceum DSM 14365]